MENLLIDMLKELDRQSDGHFSDKYEVNFDDLGEAISRLPSDDLSDMAAIMAKSVDLFGRDLSDVISQKLQGKEAVFSLLGTTAKLIAALNEDKSLKSNDLLDFLKSELPEMVSRIGQISLSYNFESAFALEMAQKTLADKRDGKQTFQDVMLDRAMREFLSVQNVLKNYRAVLRENYGLDDHAAPYFLQAAARFLLGEFRGLRSGVQDYTYRVCICRRRIQSKLLNPEQTIKLTRHIESKSAYFSGVQTCGSVWHCLPCQMKISEYRRDQIKQLQDLATPDQYSLVFGTFTLQHHRGDELFALLAVIQKAVSNCLNHRSFRKIKKETGFLGMIKALEVTWGENGFHPHFHFLFVFKKIRRKNFLDSFETEFSRLYRQSLLKMGHYASAEHGVNFFTSEDNSFVVHRYMAEVDDGWGLPEELAKSYVKLNRGKKGYSMGALLAMYGLFNDAVAGALWRKYAVATFGKRQLSWSKGLKERFGITDRTDEEIAAAAPEGEKELIAELSIEDWRKIVSEDHDHRGEIISLAVKNDRIRLQACFDRLGIKHFLGG